MLCPFCNSENIDGDDHCSCCHAALTNIADLEEKSDIELDLLRRPLGELVAQDFLTVSPKTSIRDVVAQLNKGKHHCAIVLDGHKIDGIFTERDILNKIAAQFETMGDTPVSQHMTRNPATLDYNDPVAFGLNRMMVGGYRHVPVLRDSKLIGVVSIRDILGYLLERFPEMATTACAS
jgi:CBS domain-containing protein